MKLRALSALLLALPLAACNTPTPSAPTQNSQSATPYQAHSNRALPRTAPGTFDLYLLTLSWSPEYCHSHATAAECAAHDTFVLHGLWPENSDGTYPESCSNAPGPADPTQYNGLYPDAGLLQHEWQTHGTCTGLSADGYFQTVRSASSSVRIPTAFSKLTTQTSMSPAQIEAQFTQANPGIPASGVLVTCGNNYLTAVEICMDKSLHPIACPTAIKSCHANAVRIPAP